MKIRISTLKRIIREALNEVDTDPSNNPGRPADAYEYLGMRPSPTAAMSHPSLGGGGGGGEGSSSSSAEGGGDIGGEFGPDIDSDGDVDAATSEVKESRRWR